MPSYSGNILGVITASVWEGLQRRGQYRGFEIAPPIGLDGTAAQYPAIKLAEGEMLRNHMERRDPGSDFKRVHIGINVETAKLNGDGFEMSLPREVVERLRKGFGIDLVKSYSMEMMENAFRFHSESVANIAQGSSFGSINAVTNYTQANIATINLPQDILNGVQKIQEQGGYSDTVVIPSQVWTRSRNTPEMVKFVSGGLLPGSNVLKDNALQAALADVGIRRVIIDHSMVNVASKNKVNLEYIWKPSHIWIGAGADAVQGDTVATGSQVVTSAIATMYDQTEYNTPFFIEQYEDKNRRSEILRVYGVTTVDAIDERKGIRIATGFTA